VYEIAEQVNRLLWRPEDESLREAYFQFIERVIRAEELPPINPPTTIEEIKTMAMSAREWARQSKLEGRTEGEHKIVSRQLERKFGQLSPEYLKRLDELSEDDLLTISDRIFDVNNIDEVFGIKH